jgi:serine/threonine-protein kinase
MIGRSFGSYRAVREVGRGGMGVVYAAEHPLLGSQAVVKQLRPELSAQRDVIERFFNEARAASRIVHPGIVRIFDFGYGEDGTAYFVMEFLDGESVGARLARSGPIAEAQVVRLGRQIASALTAAHEAGIVHRDLKPDNVFLVPDEAVAGGERAKILDFGIAKLGGDVGEGVAVTRTGALLGSPLYMSPEQCRGTGEVDSRADVYALGCLLFAMVTGRPPFLGSGVGEIIGKHIYEQPPRPRELVPGLSVGLDAAIMRALEKDPARRHASMRAFAAALDGVGSGGDQAAAPPVSSLAADDSASFAATADTILSTSPEAAPTIPAAAAVAETPAIATTGSGRQQRTVAMWVAAALAAGMAGFFVIARVDEGGRSGDGARPAMDRGTPATLDQPKVPLAGGAGGGGGGAGNSQPDVQSGVQQTDDAFEAEPAADAGVERMAGTAEPDAGEVGGTKQARKRARKQTRAPIERNVDSNVGKNPDTKTVKELDEQKQLKPPVFDQLEQEQIQEAPPAGE